MAVLLCVITFVNNLALDYFLLRRKSFML